MRHCAAICVLLAHPYIRHSLVPAPSAFIGGVSHKQTGATLVGNRGSITRAASSVDTLSLDSPLRGASGTLQALKLVFALESKIQAGIYDESQVRAGILRDILSSTIVIYTYSLSPFSGEAKRILNELGIRYKEIVLGPEWFLMIGEGAQKRAELGNMFGRTSLPQIFVNGNPLGGLYDGNGPGSPGLVPLLEREPGIVNSLKTLKKVDPTGNLLNVFLSTVGPR